MPNIVEKYHFGTITVEGKSYNHDVEIRWFPLSGEGHLEVLSWQREKSHIMDIVDVARSVADSPQIIIVGTGAVGMARVTEDAQKFIKEKGIELVIDKTGRAVDSFNKIQNDKKVIGLFHLTC